jgi:hypothetical protein
MIDGKHSPYRTQEHRPTARWSAGTSERATTPEPQPNVPQEASPEEDPFEIELVVPESPTAQDSPAEEQQQPKDQDIEDKANEEYTPLSDAEDEKMY